MYKISVIMPVYNAEEYLEDTLNSVINQTIGFENIELIIVDDCSTDNSRDILERYSEKYPNIKVIIMDKNSGCPGIPRNVGIKNATSDYIMFIDDDDEYFPEICDKLYNTIISENADIAVCTTLYTDNQGDAIVYFNSDKFVYDDEIVYFEDDAIWNSIFKTSIILDNNISFIDGYVEDGIFICEYSLHCKKLVYLNDYVGYHHFLRKDSTSTVSLHTELNTIKSLDILAELLNEDKWDLDRFFKHHIQRIILASIEIGNKNEIKELLSTLSDFEKKINGSNKLLITYKIINFFILRGNLNIVTYICLFISTFKKSDLFVKIHRKFFLNIYRKHL